ncbi:phage tail protein, partial [Leptospira weilii]
WPLNGFTILSGDKVGIQPYEIAFGTGGIVSGSPRSPQDSDTGLQNEVFRKLVEIQNNPDGTRSFKATIKQSELIGMNINEIGLFDEDGDLLFIKTFPSKPKDNLIVYDFIINEEFQ